MSDSGFSLINLEGASNVAIKLLDMIRDAVGWIATPRGTKKDFEDALVIYKKSFEEDSELSAIEKSAKISTARKELREYINQGKIISYAIKDLKNDAKLDVDYDWLAYFFDYAKRISDNEVQQIWARLLSEQCNGDSSVTRTLIHILSLIDTKTALAFGNLCKITFKHPKLNFYEQLGTKFISEYIPFVISPTLYRIPLALPEETVEKKMALEYIECVPAARDLAILQEIGLIAMPERRNTDFEYPYKVGLVNHDFSGKGNKYKGTEIKDYIIQYCDKKYKIVPKDGGKLEYSANGEQISDSLESKLPETIKFGSIKFTTVGKKLFELLDPEYICGFETIFKMYIEAQGFNVEEIKRC